MKTTTDIAYQPTDEDLIKAFKYFLYYFKLNGKSEQFNFDSSIFTLSLVQADNYLYLDIGSTKVITELIEKDSHENFLLTFIQNIPLDEREARSQLYQKFLAYPRKFQQTDIEIKG